MQSDSLSDALVVRSDSQSDVALPLNRDERTSVVSPQSVDDNIVSRVSTVPRHNVETSSHQDLRWFERGSGWYARPRIHCRVIREQTFATWNVEGLGADNCKLSEIFYHMTQHNIAVLAIQETHVKGMHHFYQDGFLVILSGEAVEKAGRSFSGVGFVVASWALSSIVGFRLISDRLVSLKLRVVGGLLRVLSAYAPHSAYRYEVRKDFFDHLLSAWGSVGSHTCTMALAWRLQCKII